VSTHGVGIMDTFSGHQTAPELKSYKTPVFHHDG